jgi:hypothetical protein
MNEIATYTFLPWLRQGLANQINGQEGSRATIPVDVTIKGKKVDGSADQIATVSKSIEIYGPGDIIGIDKRAIIKEEPRNWITNFEPNYLPYIEFYDEDFPWRYTPLPNPANDHRLKPWLALIVLKEDEFEHGQNIKDKPLPFITVKDTGKLPDLEQSWAWAHVQVNESLLSETELIEGEPTPKVRFDNNANTLADALDQVIRRNPDLAYSRIFCPRRLQANIAYHAFLVPAFETGRLAGLGQNPDSANFNTRAWDTVAGEKELPFYHNWYFRTGNVGDFEYLVRLLEPKPIDSRVGTRDMDVQKPGANLKGLEEADLHGILKLGGALRIPASSQKDKAEAEKYEYWAFRGDKTPEEIALIADKSNSIEQPLNIDNLHPLQSNIARFINLSDTYQDKDIDKTIEAIHSDSGIEQAVGATDESEYDITNNPDPLITAPLYGQWHALTQRLAEERDGSKTNPNYNWIHELNLDPRWRVSAGFGTRVVQENQENYMKAAWEQLGDVLEANKKIREAQFAKITANIWYKKHVAPLFDKSPSLWLQVSAPIHTRVLSPINLSNGTQRLLSVHYQKQESKLTTAATSVMMRKVMRPRGKFVKKRLPFTDQITPDNLITRINEGEVSAAPPRQTPNGIQKPQDLVNAARPDNAPQFLLDWLRRFPWLRWIPLAIAVLLLLFLLFFTPAWAIASVVGVVAAMMVYLFLWMSDLLKRMRAADQILEENQTPESVDNLPNSPDFRITGPDEAFTPTFSSGGDSAELQRFKDALKDANEILQESRRIGTVAPRPALNIDLVNIAVFEKINPLVTIPNWVMSGLYLPPFLVAQQRETFKEAEAYPVFDLPMYKPMADYSAEMFLPNINFIDQNSISLLETNQKFIEAYMVGLNHEFARELLWREYPTDQRGSYFRQFWETNGLMDTELITRDTLKARYKKVFEGKGFYIPELVEYKEKLEDSTIATLDDIFLAEAHRHILKEELRDIKPIHYWSKNARLGDHDYRELPGENEEEAVLVIRGELLKKYPTAVIYAHRAVWQDKDGNPVLGSNQTIDNTKERTLHPLNASEEVAPPRHLVKTPLYEAKVDPDIYFFGFDLTIPEANGGDGSNPTDNPGWFFVIKERPGEPRLGLDIGDVGNVVDNKIELWNDLNWGDIKPAVAEGAYLQITNDTPAVSSDQSLEADDREKNEQRREDMQVRWHRDMNAAELAYILYQVPVLVAVHASEMLPD